MRLTFVLFAALLGGASAVLAQGPTFEGSITVTATTVPEPVAEVPTAADVFDAASIAERKAGQAIDLLCTVPGLELARGGSPGKATSLFTRGTNSSHTLVLWNGVELNDPYLGGFDWSTLATEDIARLEVVRGPYSALYGSSALGGVVQLISRRQESGGRLRAEGGENDFARLGASGGFALGKVQVDLAGHLRQGDGEIDNDFYDGHEVDLGLDGSLGDSVRLGLQVRRGANEIGVPYDFSGLPSPERRQRFATTAVAVPFSYTTARGSIEAQAATSDSDLEFRDAADPFAASDTAARRDQGRLVVRRQLGDDLELVAGGDWNHERASSQSAFGEGLSDDSAEAWAAFGQLSYTRGRLRLDAGARRDDDRQFGGATSLRGALAWTVAGATRLRAAYGEAFRAPSLADLYYPGFGNPELEPEESRSIELGVDSTVGPLRLAATLFENELTNLIEFDYLTFLPRNLGAARIRGLEAGAAAQLGRLEARLAATWLDAENLSTGGALLRRADFSGSLTLFWRQADWTAGAVARYVGERVDFGDLALPSYATLDLTLARRFAERWEPFVRLENALDADYAEIAGYPAPGRTFSAGVEWSF